MSIIPASPGLLAHSAAFTSLRGLAPMSWGLGVALTIASVS